MQRFLFVFGYEEPGQRGSNDRLKTDFESSHAVWIRTDSEEEAMERGRDYADEFVRRLFEQAGTAGSSPWNAQGFAHWISQRPLEEFSNDVLETFDEI